MIEAVEGKGPFFRCQEVRYNGLFAEKDKLPDNYVRSPCLISQVMHDGEHEMQRYLSTKTIQWLHDQVFNEIYTPELRAKTTAWFETHCW